MDDPNAVEDMDIDNTQEPQPAMEIDVPEIPAIPDRSINPEELAAALLKLQSQAPEPKASSIAMDIDQPAKKPSQNNKGPLPYTGTISSGKSPAKRKPEEVSQRPAGVVNPKDRTT